MGTIKPNLQESESLNHQIIHQHGNLSLLSPKHPRAISKEYRDSKGITTIPFPSLLSRDQKTITCRIISIPAKHPKIQSHPPPFSKHLGFSFFNHLPLELQEEPGEAGKMKGEGAELPNSPLWVPGLSSAVQPHLPSPSRSSCRAAGSVLIPPLRPEIPGADRASWENSSGNVFHARCQGWC